MFLLLSLFSLVAASVTQHFKVSYDPDYAPYSYNVKGKPYGLFIDIYRVWAKKNGYEIQFVNGKTWDNAIDLAKRGKVDFFLGTNPYEKWMKASKPYYKTKTSLFTLKSQIGLPGTIGIIGEDLKDELYTKFKEIKIVSYTTYKELIDALLEHKVGAIYDDSVALSDYVLKNNKNYIIKKLNLFSSTSNICAISNDTKKIEIFNDGFKNIKKKTLIDIEQDWITDKSQRYYEIFYKTQKDIFTNSEKEWLDKNPIIRVAVMNYWKSDDNGNSLHTEILKLLNKFSGINLVPIKYNTWKDGFSDAIKGSNVYAIMGLSYSKKREEKYFYYTKAYHFTPYYLITRKNDSSIKSFKDLKNKTVYVKEKSIINLIMKKKSPTTKIIQAKSLNDIYSKMLTSKKADGIVAYYKNVKDLKKYNLKIVETLYDRYGEVAIGVNHKYPQLASIINKAFKLIPKTVLAKVRDKVYEKTKVDKIVTPDKISFVSLLSPEEITFAFFILILLGYIGYKQYTKSTVLNINLSIFSILIVVFNLAVIFFLTYETIVLDKTSNSLAQAYKYRYNMSKIINRLRQSSDDLTHFARTYATTADEKFKQRYFDTLAIRNGNLARPQGYDGIYWDLDKTLRESRHPQKEKIALKDIIKKLPFSKIEIAKLKESEDNSNDLVNLEEKAFKDLKENRQQEAVMILFSPEYYKAKQEIMLPLDDLITILDNRTKMMISLTNKKGKLQFEYILFTGVFFILGNLLIYLLLRRKINEPINYLTDVIKRFQNGEKEVKEKLFYNDEIGIMKREFFQMKTIIDTQYDSLEEIHKHSKEAIEYAAIIQSTLIPDNNMMRKYFKDQFVIWKPKDIVGGDIYFFDELQNDDECLLMVIDCTGHGVPGAFVTMLVKAIERQVIAEINSSDERVNPAKILSIFNQSMKHLLKQEGQESLSNVGFDGQILYYNKKDKIIKCASAKNEIFYYQDNVLHIIKGDRHSIGYKDSDRNYNFTEHSIDVSKETTIYLSSDGYWDQNGGQKALPFGKKRLKKMLDEIHDESMANQQEEFLYTLEEYKNGYERNDDITVIGFKV